MDQKTLRERIEKPDRSLLKETDSLSDSDFAYLAGLVLTKKASRELMLDLAEGSKTKAAREALLKGLRDPEAQIRYQAIGVILSRPLPDEAKQLLEVLQASGTESPDRDEFAKDLAQAVGNTGDKNAVEPLLVLRKKERRPEAAHAYHQALAKLGFPKDTRQLDFDLQNGSPLDKARALRDLRYMAQAEWMPKVVPLLLDETVARHTSMGPATFRIRVCDEAITTLGLLDPHKKIPFEVSDVFGHPFSEDQLAAARKAYGLPE